MTLGAKLEVSGSAGSGEEALAALATVTSDVVLVDFAMLGMKGAVLIRQLGNTHPQARSLVVASHNKGYYVDASFAASARGYIYL